MKKQFSFVVLLTIAFLLTSVETKAIVVTNPPTRVTNRQVRRYGRQQARQTNRANLAKAYPTQATTVGNDKENWATQHPTQATNIKAIEAHVQKTGQEAVKQQQD